MTTLSVPRIAVIASVLVWAGFASAQAWYPTAVCIVRSQTAVASAIGVTIKWVVEVQNTNAHALTPELDGNYGFYWKTKPANELPDVAEAVIGAPAHLGESTDKEGALEIASGATASVTVSGHLEKDIAISSLSARTPYDGAFVQFGPDKEGLRCNLREFPGIVGPEMKALSCGTSKRGACAQ